MQERPKSKPIRSMLKVTRKTFFNPVDWFDLRFLRIETSRLIRGARTSFAMPDAGAVETFDEAMIRQGVTEEDLKKLYSQYRTTAFVFLFFGLIVFIYAFFLLFSLGPLSGWILGLAICGLFLSQAFRFDFWALQIKKRKLGMTGDEWKQHYLGNGKSTKS